MKNEKLVYDGYNYYLHSQYPSSGVAITLYYLHIQNFCEGRAHHCKGISFLCFEGKKNGFLFLLINQMIKMVYNQRHKDFDHDCSGPIQKLGPYFYNSIPVVVLKMDLEIQ